MRGEREEETGSVVRGMPGRGGLPRLDGMRSRTRALLLTALAGVMLLGAAPLAASADVDDADVNDFDYSSWHSRVELGMDAEGRSTAHVTETLVAEFPTTDQNRGIVRGYPERYEGAGLSLDIVSVTDADGEPVPHEVDAGENGVTYVLTGDDDFVHGPTTYVIEYTMRDVLLAAEGSGLDEFYWDLLPLDSTQDIGQFSADIVLSPRWPTPIPARAPAIRVRRARLRPARSKARRPTATCSSCDRPGSRPVTASPWRWASTRARSCSRQDA